MYHRENVFVRFGSQTSNIRSLWFRQHRDIVVSLFPFLISMFFARRFIMEWGETFGRLFHMAVRFLKFRQRRLIRRRSIYVSFKILLSRKFLTYSTIIRFKRFTRSGTKFPTLITISIRNGIFEDENLGLFLEPNFFVRRGRCH